MYFRNLNSVLPIFKMELVAINITKNNVDTLRGKGEYNCLLGTMLQAGMSRVRFPMRSFDFFQST
jgi:hypothetical protein